MEMLSNFWIKCIQRLFYFEVVHLVSNPSHTNWIYISSSLLTWCLPLQALALKSFTSDFPVGSHCDHCLVSLGVILTFRESHLVLLCAESLLKMLITWLPPLIQLVHKCDVCKLSCIVLSKLLIFFPQTIFARKFFQWFGVGEVHPQTGGLNIFIAHLLKLCVKMHRNMRAGKLWPPSFSLTVLLALDFMWTVVLRVALSSCWELVHIWTATKEYETVLVYKSLKLKYWYIFEILHNHIHLIYKICIIIIRQKCTEKHVYLIRTML